LRDGCLSAAQFAAAKNGALIIANTALWHVNRLELDEA
jgi:hypothetical protein